MPRIDVAGLLARYPIESVVSPHVALVASGTELRGRCPFHDDKTPSFFVSPSKQKYICHGCGKGGDAIDFVRNKLGVSFLDAVNFIRQEVPSVDEKTPETRQQQIVPLVITGAVGSPEAGKPIQVWNPGRGRFNTYTPAQVYTYANHKNEVIGHVLRINTTNGKITPSIMWCRFGDQTGWCHHAFPEPRPLYNLQHSAATVMVVEGEKAADAASLLLPSYNVVTWPGGVNAWRKADWSKLRGKQVILWPDADEPGRQAMQAIAVHLAAFTSSVRLLAVENTRPQGWDAADALAEGWDTAQAVQWAKSVVAPVVADAPVEPSPSIEAYDEAAASPDNAPIEMSDNPHFRFLGHNAGIFYYLPKGNQQIFPLTPGQHTKNNLMVLAPLHYWQMQYPAAKSSFNVDAATNALIQTSISKGFFSPNDLRGRGAWLDNRRSVLHTGTVAYVDGVACSPCNIPNTKYVYQGGTELMGPPSTAATVKDAQKFVDICKTLSWRSPVYGILLAGWCIVAPVCGMLRWRPHIWVTGPSQAGKTTIIKTIIAPILGSMGLFVDGKTTEAGIRQRLGSDALPVVYDEAEGEDQDSRQRLQNVLNMARIASSGGETYKGSSDGKGVAYCLRSCFCFSSINPHIQHFADESRVTRLILRRDITPGADARYKALACTIGDLLTPEYANGILSRSLVNLTVLSRNCEIFVEAAAKVFGSRRLADQVGTMLGGAYLCSSSRPIVLDAAIKWLEGQDWGDILVPKENPDEERLLDTLLSHCLNVSTEKGMRTATIGELILQVTQGGAPHNVSYDEALRELRRHGIDIESLPGEGVETCFFVANRCEPLRRILKDTPWASEWGRPLRDLPGAVSADMRYYSPGVKSRGTRIPVSVIT